MRDSWFFFNRLWEKQLTVESFHNPPSLLNGGHHGMRWFCFKTLNGLQIMFNSKRLQPSKGLLVGCCVKEKGVAGFSFTKVVLTFRRVLCSFYFKKMQPASFSSTCQNF